MISPTSEEIEVINNYLSSDAELKQRQFEKLKRYVELLLLANEKHNLIGKNTIQSVWSRHIIDSLQLVSCVRENKKGDNKIIFDLGSGAGFPAIVLGIITGYKIVMVEKSPVKSQFLSRVCQELHLEQKVINESVNKNNISTFLSSRSVITSRAFKSISEIFDLIDDKVILSNIDKIVLLKGERWKAEIEEYLKKKQIAFGANKCSDLFDVRYLEKFRMEVKKSILGEGVVLHFSRF